MYTLVHADCFDWLAERQPESIHGVVTDPPYAVIEFSSKQLQKMREGNGGVWRIPPAIGGSQRRPLPRFTVLTEEQLAALHEYFHVLGQRMLHVLVPGGHMLVASTPLLSYRVAYALVQAGFERRGEIIRLGAVTMRGGDRPKNAEQEFSDLSVMPRGAYEPWLLFRKPIAETTVAENLRVWRAGALRRPSPEVPFFDVIESTKTPAEEREIADHPSLKPQAFLRQVVWSILPFGEGIVLDPFAGSGSTLAAAEAVGYKSIGIERDDTFYQMACRAIPQMAKLNVKLDSRHTLSRNQTWGTLPMFSSKDQ